MYAMPRISWYRYSCAFGNKKERKGIENAKTLKSSHHHHTHTHTNLGVQHGQDSGRLCPLADDLVQRLGQILQHQVEESLVLLRE